MNKSLYALKPFLVLLMFACIWADNAAPSDEDWNKPVRDSIGDCTGNRELWNKLISCVSGGDYFGAQGAWLDEQHNSIVCVLFKPKDIRAVPMYEYTNALAAIIDNKHGINIRAGSLSTSGTREGITTKEND